MKIKQIIKNQNSAKRLDLSSQVAIDIANYLDQFPNKSFALKFLSKEAGLNNKTLKRLLEKKNRPTYQTLFRLYSVIFCETDYSKLLCLCPKPVREMIEKFSPCEEITNAKESDDFLNLMKRDSLIAELYVLAGTGPLQKSVVGFRYGQYGLELLETLIKKNYLVKIDNDSYVISPSISNLDSEALKLLGEYFVARHLKDKNSQVKSENTISFYAESLNHQGKLAWLSLDTEYFYKKLEIANNPKFKGNIKMFTFTATDTISSENYNV